MLQVFEILKSLFQEEENTEALESLERLEDFYIKWLLKQLYKK